MEKKGQARSWKAGSILLAALLTLVIVAGCGGAGEGASPTASQNAASPSPTSTGTTEEAAQAAELVELRLNVVSTGTQSIPAFLIERLALDEKHGFKLESVPDSGAVNANWTAFKTGKIDGMITDWISLARNVEQGDKAVAVVPFLGWGNGILVPEDSPVHSLADLKDIQVGVYNRLAPDWLFIRAAAKQLHGFDPEKDNVVAEAAPGLLLGLMQEGKVDAALNYGDLNSMLLGMGGFKMPFEIKSIMTDIGLSTEAPFLFYTFNETFMVEHPDTVKAFAAAYKEAIEFLNSDEAIWTEIAERLKIDNETTIGLMKENARSNIFTEMTPAMEGNIGSIFDVLLQEAGEKELG
ncbi:MAG: hypothetical protein K0Q63_3385, partial [Paenibacillus sp.]|nr:hypothetical protein [Paenibacillus sp.]